MEAGPGDTIRPRDLASPQARALLERAQALAPRTDPLALVAALRRDFPGADPSLVSAVATQARLRARAVPRLGLLAERLVLSDAGLQQASRGTVAAYRAAQLRLRLGDAGRDDEPLVADLGCGLGVDALALSDAGFRVRAIESDPWTAEAAALNCTDRPGVEIVEGDALTADLAGCHAAFCDPSRRDPSAPLPTHGRGRAPRVGHPEQWSPPWPWVVDLARRLPVVAKASAGLPGSAVPEDAEREWIEVAGEVVECCVWFAPLGEAGVRRATILAAGDALSLAAGPLEHGTRVTDVAQAYLLEPAAAVTAAGLVEAVATRFARQGIIAELIGGWLTASQDPASPWVRAWRVIEELPASSRAMRDALRGAGQVTWKTADIRESAEDVAQRVRHRPAAGAPPTTVILLANGSAWRAELPDPRFPTLGDGTAAP